MCSRRETSTVRFNVWPVRGYSPEIFQRAVVSVCLGSVMTTSRMSPSEVACLMAWRTVRWSVAMLKS